MAYAMNFAHASGFFSPARAKPTTLVGVGAVGSYVALALVKAGLHELTVWDYDYVSSHNAPMSLYGPQDLGRLKVEALQDHIQRLTGVTIKICSDQYETQKLLTPVVVSCVDDMPTRKRIWTGIEGRFSPEIFCDTRLGYAYVEVLTVRPNLDEDRSLYKALLFEDEEALQQTCGHHGVVFASMYAAAVVSSNITAYLSARPYKWRVAERCDTLQRVF